MVCPISFKFGMQASLMLVYTMVSFDYFEGILVAEIEASDNSMCTIIGALLYTLLLARLHHISRDYISRLSPFCARPGVYNVYTYNACMHN